MMDKMNLIISALRAAKYITPLEKDILDTVNELQKYPFDMNSAELQILSNNCNHSELVASVEALPTTRYKTREQIGENDLRYILEMHLTFLIKKEIDKNTNFVK